MNGLKTYFNRSCRLLLLYPQERLASEAVRTDGCRHAQYASVLDHELEVIAYMHWNLQMQPLCSHHTRQSRIPNSPASPGCM